MCAEKSWIFSAETWFFSEIYHQIANCQAWLEEMGGDFGRTELEYSKRKAEDDLEQLEQSWRVLSNIESEADSTDEVRQSAAECKVKLEEAMKKLREFLKEVSVAVDYDQKQQFLITVSTEFFVWSLNVGPVVIFSI